MAVKKAKLMSKEQFEALTLVERNNKWYKVTDQICRFVVVLACCAASFLWGFFSFIGSILMFLVLDIPILFSLVLSMMVFLLVFTYSLIGHLWIYRNDLKKSKDGNRA